MKVSATARKCTVSTWAVLLLPARWTRLTANKQQSHTNCCIPLESLHNPDDLAVSPTWAAGRPHHNNFWLWYGTNCGEPRCKTSLGGFKKKNKPLATLELFLELLWNSDLHRLNQLANLQCFGYISYRPTVIQPAAGSQSLGQSRQLSSLSACFLIKTRALILFIAHKQQQIKYNFSHNIN